MYDCLGSTLKDDRGEWRRSHLRLAIIQNVPYPVLHNCCPFDIDFLLFHNIYISKREKIQKAMEGKLFIIVLNAKLVCDLY